MSTKKYAREIAAVDATALDLVPDAEWVQFPVACASFIFVDGQGEERTFTDLAAGECFFTPIRTIVSSAQKIRVGAGEGPISAPGAVGATGPAGNTAQVRGVVTANVADLAAFTVAANDGLTYVEGEYVLLAGQTTAAQCGPYLVGAVAGGTAPLTRASWMPAAAAVRNGMVIEASEGTLWAGSSWKAMCTGAKVVGTDDPLFYPKVIHRTITLVAGTLVMGAGGDTVATPLFSTTKSQVELTRNTPNTCTATTGGYSAAAAGRTAGKAGAVTIIAAVAAGTINVADISTLDVTITNW
jgi:hypothetical protein